MLTFVMWVIFVGVGLCAALFSAIIVLIAMSLFDSLKSRYVGQPPARAAERMYDQQYFDRAVGNSKK